MTRDAIAVAPNVAAALDAGQPVVALESTIIAHGLPRPANLETARAVEQVVREHGAVPATIAVLDGRPTVGLSDEQLSWLANADDVVKCSRRDLAWAVATSASGATTVAATMYLAHRAGIQIFVTGGIGGVHRGAERSMDVSADLLELSRTPVVVISAGAKAILDLERTLEQLETLGVPVVGYRTAELPAFYCRTSGLPLPQRLDSIDQLATLVSAHLDLGAPSGLLVANPISVEAALEPAPIEEAIEKALEDAARLAVTGKQLTPFLLSRVVAATGGAALTANIALVKSNAALGAALAAALVGTSSQAR